MVAQFENGSFILLMLVPPRVPHIARLHIILSLQVFGCPDLFKKKKKKKRSCCTEAARCSPVMGQSKSGGPGGRASWWGSPLKLTLFRG